MAPRFLKTKGTNDWSRRRSAAETLESAWSSGTFCLSGLVALACGGGCSGAAGAVGRGPREAWQPSSPAKPPGAFQPSDF